MAEFNLNTPKRPEEAENGSAPRTATKKGEPRRRSARTRFNLFDLLIVFVVVVTIVLLATGIRLTDVLGLDREGTEVRLSYTLTLYDVDEELATAIRSGDVLYDAQTKAVIGVVKQTPTSVPSQRKALLTAADGTSSVVMRSVPGYVDVTVHVTADASYEQGVGYAVNGVTVRVGEGYQVRTAQYTGQAYCTAFNGAVRAE